ncbi:MAG: class I SAM-dependent methyltransferase [Bryobacteraceae bacterium]
MNCDGVAPYYAALEFAVFGRMLENCRFHFLPELTGVRRALVMGDGDGRFLKRLLAACPGVRVDYVDCSAAMLAKARLAAGSEQVAYHCLDALTEELPSADYDLVAMHFFLDCFGREQQAAMVDRVAGVAPRARWLISEFRVPRNRWLTGPGRGLIGVMYGFFGVATGLRTRGLVDHRGVVGGAGFKLAASVEFGGGLVVSELWAPGCRESLDTARVGACATLGD